jgi:DNA-nicking Smr family endonuclease
MAARAPSREERALWRAAMRDVAPLAGEAPPPAPPTPPPAPAPRRHQRPEHAAAPRRPLRTLAAGEAPDLDRRSQERLKRGQLRIEGRLDLHGMTQAEAHAALDRFLARAEADGRRCVLVITGKGFRRGAESLGGILKGAVPRWLNEAPNRARLLAFAAAHPKDGGDGAIYVLLKRRRAP